MAEYIERGILMERLYKKRPEPGRLRYIEGFNDAISRVRSMVHSAPAADVVEVVRCKDCKHLITDAFKRTMCNRTFTMFEMQPNDFCSYGERKDGTDNER